MKKGEKTTPVMLLGEKHIVILLIAMFDANRRIKMSELYEYAQSRTVEILTTRMAQEGLIKKRLEKETYATTFLELTPKGRAVAEKLKEAVDLLQNH